MYPHFYAVIMAGGGGTRLWPLSRRARPKQMLSLIDSQSLFQAAVRRLESLFPVERILIVTNEAQSVELSQQCPELLAENFLLEPEPRGTAAAIGLATMHLKSRDPQAVMAVLTADHFIGDEQRFCDYLAAAEALARQGYLVTLGIEPSYAATQYGYIQMGETIGGREGFEAYQVVRFKEKPDEAEAGRLLESGDHAWNSGMFIWQVERIWQEFTRQMPDLARSLEHIGAAWTGKDGEAVLRQEWMPLATQTIDYGIMENARNVAVIPAKEMLWNDVGSWNSLFEVLQPDADGNVVISENFVNFGGQGSLVHTNGQGHMVVMLGTKDLVVVDTGDVLLICSKERAQEVRKVIDFLKENGLTSYL